MRRTRGHGLLELILNQQTAFSGQPDIGRDFGAAIAELPGQPGRSAQAENRQRPRAGESGPAGANVARIGKGADELAEVGSLGGAADW